MRGVRSLLTPAAILRGETDTWVAAGLSRRVPPRRGAARSDFRRPRRDKFYQSGNPHLSKGFRPRNTFGARTVDPEATGHGDPRPRTPCRPGRWTQDVGMNKTARRRPVP